MSVCIYTHISIRNMCTYICTTHWCLFLCVCVNMFVDRWWKYTWYVIKGLHYITFPENVCVCLCACTCLRAHACVCLCVCRAQNSQMLLQLKETTALFDALLFLKGVQWILLDAAFFFPLRYCSGVYTFQSSLSLSLSATVSTVAWLSTVSRG